MFINQDITVTVFALFVHELYEQKAYNDHQCTLPSKYLVNFTLTISCELDSSLSSLIYLTINIHTSVEKIMKASNTQLALAVAAALASTSVLANNDTQKLQEQLDALQKEVSALKTTTILTVLTTPITRALAAAIFFLVVFVLTLKVSTEIGITSYYSNLLKALLK